MTLVSDLLAIEDPASIASSTVVSYTCGTSHTRTNGSIAWIHKTIHRTGTIRTETYNVKCGKGYAVLHIAKEPSPLTETLIGDILAIEDPASIASSTVVNYTSGICHTRTTGHLTGILKTLDRRGTIITPWVSNNSSYWT